MSGTHARLSASSAYRWMNCPGSANLIDQWGGDNTSQYAAEGTTAHELGSKCLESDRSPWTYIGDEIEADGFTFTVDDGMCEAVETYIEEVRDRRALWGHKETELLVEQSLTEPLKALHPDFGGTADALLYHAESKTLAVYDYKHGAGVLVDVNDNPQLKYYALGALLSVPNPVDTVCIFIVQPRCDHADGPVRGQVIEAVDLLDFAGDVLKAAEAACDPNAPLAAGYWCRFCPAAHACPELEKYQQLLMGEEFDVVYELPPETIAKALDIFPMIEARITAVRERAYQDALKGSPPPGYKLVDKRATRKYTDKAAVATVLSGEKDCWTEPKVKTPAQVEKALGKKRYGQVVEPLVEKKSSGYNLVPEDHPKPASVLASPEDFDEVIEK